MLARIRKSAEEKDQGFTLIELLVVMIIIGILAAIAIPVFLNQRKKAQDSAAKADVSTIGKEIATYFVDSSNVTGLAVGVASARYQLTGGDLSAAVDLGKVSNNVVLAAQDIDSGTDWCVSVRNAQGDKAVVGYKYSAAGGLEEGVCVVD
jgi:prepilin-type N-terminal cleavage/methylation domain-containing protein